ncbi:MAG TPA: KpsF/GutQ family sugar-phosphate isomerase [Pyrinomonadaceae bacterium]|nr:KpsF/GutQ family sugar-phosphate isomerase [Pyrinomonadaceae bacterium]
MTDKTHASNVIGFLQMEAHAIEQTAARLDHGQIERVVDLLIKCRGKVVMLGIGKSGIIAQKIAATMTSTGTPALFLHPSDAVHGGIGIVDANDAVIALSNSGETDELLALLPYLRHRGVPLIAVVGNLNSTLAQRADAVLDASVTEEACPLNLAPTTSTTVALALGDALALTLMSIKGLTPDEFAVNHPGGRLGKRLTLKVCDLMHAGERNATVGTSARWLDVVRAISSGGLGAVCVIDEEGKLAGLITDGDLRRAIERLDQPALEVLTCSDFMTRSPIAASPDLLAYDALRLMEERSSQISVLPVVDDQQFCVGLIRLHDIVGRGI